MPKKEKAVKLKIQKDEIKIEKGDDSLIGKLMEGCKGSININLPRGTRKVKLVKKFKAAPKKKKVKGK